MGLGPAAGVQSGGTISGNLSILGDLTISGNLTVQGTSTSVVNTTTSGKVTITVADANALAVGPNGETNPTLKIDTNTSSAATGLEITGAAATAGVALLVLSSGTNEALNIDSKGSGDINLQGTATGNLTLGNGRFIITDGGENASPAVAIGDTNTGVYNQFGGQLSFATNGIDLATFANDDSLRLTSTVTIGWASAGSDGSNADVEIGRDAANILALRQSNNPQEFRIYNTDVASDDEFASLGFINNSNVFTIQTEALASGTVRNMALMGGLVGINTAAPQSLLDVQGDEAAPGLLTLATKGTTTVGGDVLGRINFNAPLDGAGGDAILAGASIWAEADDTFTSILNSTELVFGTATTSVAIEGMRLTKNRNLGLGISNPGGALDIQDGELCIIIGGDNDSTKSRTDATDKFGRLTGAHFTNAEEPTTLLFCGATTSANTISMGGGTSLSNAATELRFFTAGNNTTTVGTQRVTIDSGGQTGFGVNDPDTQVEILFAGNQLKLSFDGTDNAIFAVDTSGNMAITTSSGATTITNGVISSTIDATTDFTIGSTIITDGVITDSTGLQIASNLTMGNDFLIARDVNAGITASTTQSQGNGALTAEINEISVVGSADDTVTLITAVAGLKIVIINNGANQLQIFPASSDDLGQGSDNPVSIAAGSNITFASFDATNWETI